MLPNGTNTFVGIILFFTPLVASWFGLTPTPTFAEEAPEMVSAIIALFGGAYAIYGRLRAQTPGWFSRS